MNTLSNFRLRVLTFQKQVEGFAALASAAHPTWHGWEVALPAAAPDNSYGSVATYLHL